MSTSDGESKPVGEPLTYNGSMTLPPVPERPDFSNETLDSRTNVATAAFQRLCWVRTPGRDLPALDDALLAASALIVKWAWDNEDEEEIEPTCKEVSKLISVDKEARLLCERKLVGKCERQWKSRATARAEPSSTRTTPTGAWMLESESHQAVDSRHSSMPQTDPNAKGKRSTWSGWSFKHNRGSQVEPRSDQRTTSETPVQPAGSHGGMSTPPHSSSQQFGDGIPATAGSSNSQPPPMTKRKTWAGLIGKSQK